MTLNVNPGAVGMSAATEVGIATDLAASSGATSEALLVNMPMALDADSLAFAEALSGAGAAYTGVKAEHVAELVPQHHAPVDVAVRRRHRGDHLAEAHAERAQVGQPDGAHAVVIRVLVQLDGDRDLGREAVALRHVGNPWRSCVCA